MNKKRYLNLRKYAIVAAVVFWLPDIVEHVVRRDHFGGIDALCLTFLLPLITCLAIAYTWKRSGDIGKFRPAGWTAVLGVWVLGPAMMLVGGGFGNSARFFHPGWSQEIVLGTFFFPITTWVGSTYDGTLGALIIVTAALPLMSLRLKHQPQLGPLPSTK